MFIVAIEHVCKWTGGWWDFYIVITSLSLDFCFNDWLSVHKTSSISLHKKTKANLYLFSRVPIYHKNPQLFDTVNVFLQPSKADFSFIIYLRELFYKINIFPLVIINRLFSCMVNFWKQNQSLSFIHCIFYILSLYLGGIISLYIISQILFVLTALSSCLMSASNSSSPVFHFLPLVSTPPPPWLPTAYVFRRTSSSTSIILSKPAGKAFICRDTSLNENFINNNQ